jgi:Leucine-rich repeat (LRR) protein
MIGLEIENGSVSNLTGTELASYPHLKMLRLDFNQITRIPGNFFQFNPELISVSFKSNWIKSVGKQLLDRLRQIQLLNFNFNQCINTVTNKPNQVPSILRALRRDCLDGESADTTN